MDQADDIRGGMGWEGLMELVKFVREGGTLITEGSTSTIFPEYNITTGVTVENPDGLFVRGSVMRGVVTDRRSPIAYGYDAQVPVYFSQDPVLNVGGGGGFGGFGGGGGRRLPGVGMNTHADGDSQSQQRLSIWDPDDVRRRRRRPAAVAVDGGGAAAAAAAGGGGGGGGGGFGGGDAGDRAARRPAVPVESGRHAAVGRAGRRSGARRTAPRSSTSRSARATSSSFAIRPFWRWQTQGTFFLGFNTILNWNDLDAGKAGPRRTTAAAVNPERCKVQGAASQGAGRGAAAHLARLARCTSEHLALHVERCTAHAERLMIA